MYSSRQKDKFREVKIIFLSAAIVFFFGVTIDRFFNPILMILTPENMVIVEDMIDRGCPELRNAYDNNITPEGHIEIKVAEDIIWECNQQIQSDVLFYSLIREFQRHRR